MDKHQCEKLLGPQSKGTPCFGGLYVHGPLRKVAWSLAGEGQRSLGDSQVLTAGKRARWCPAWRKAASLAVSAAAFLAHRTGKGVPGKPLWIVR